MGSIPCSRIAATCAGTSRRPRSPPWIFGWSVFTRPSSISGKPVWSLTWRTGTPASARSFAVPPVERISTPSAGRPRANSTTPRLSLTLTSARRTSAIGEFLDVDARDAPPDGGQHLVRDGLAPAGELVRADAVAEEGDPVPGCCTGDVRHVDHRVVHAD